MNIAIILAGGVGSRVGANVPKQFIEVYEKPIIAYTLDVFENHPEIDAIEIVCVKEYIYKLSEIISKYNYSKVKYVAEGGKDFQHSVINGIFNLENKINDDDVVLIHWAASPFVTNEIISDCIKVASEKGNSISANPCYLLYGSNDNGKSTKFIDRDSIVTMSAPQGFNYNFIKNLYKKAINDGLLDKVEPHTTSLMYFMGETIYLARGCQTNIKITTKEDIELFKGYIGRKYNESKKI